MLIVFRTCSASQRRGAPKVFEEHFMTFQQSTETGTKTASDLTQINWGKSPASLFPHLPFKGSIAHFDLYVLSRCAACKPLHAPVIVWSVGPGVKTNERDAHKHGEHLCTHA